MEFLGVHWCGKLLVGLLHSIVGSRRAGIFFGGYFSPYFVKALSPMPRIVDRVPAGNRWVRWIIYKGADRWRGTTRVASHNKASNDWAVVHIGLKND